MTAEERIAEIERVHNVGRFALADSEITWLIAEARAAKQREVEALEVIAMMVDYDDCRLDHHGFCQTHGCGDPCDMAEAWKFLKERDPEIDQVKAAPRALTTEGK